MKELLNLLPRVRDAFAAGLAGIQLRVRLALSMYMLHVPGSGLQPLPVPAEAVPRTARLVYLVTQSVRVYNFSYPDFDPSFSGKSLGIP